MKQATILTFALLSAAGCNFRLVGGVCLDGYVEHDGACIEAGSVLGGAGEGASEAGGADAGGGHEGGAGAHAVGGGGPVGGGPVGGGPVGGQGSGGGGPDCGELAACGQSCVDLDNDPENCGFCGHVCQTALCGDGQCEGASAGHVAAIGIDFGAVAPGSSAARLLGNAVFLHPHEPVRVAVYAQDAEIDVTTKVISLVNGEAAARGRAAQVVSAMDPAALAGTAAALQTDVIVVPPQPYSENGEMSDVAAVWAQPFQDFIGSGGVVVVLAQGAGSQELLSASQWLGPLDLAPLPLQSLHISSWLDSLSVGVLSPFALSHAATSLTPGGPFDPMTQVVVTTGDDAPVVIHRVVVPGP